jgi:oligosaccharide reducing-end xylanase
VLEERQRVPLSVVKAQLNDAFRQLFFGDPQTEAVYFPQGDGTGYIQDIAHGDVRTDSMAYGMLVTVQLDQREIFDELWAWTKRHMLSTSGPSAGLLRWRCATTGRDCSADAATDASSIIATTLLLAERRWGRAGAHSYQAEAEALLASLSAIEERNGGVVDGVVNCFDPNTGLPRASSLQPAAEAPVDYLMPAFYELWARHDGARAEFWRRAAASARVLLAEAAHPDTGLLPEVVTHTGDPVSGRDAYRATTARALLNMALDHLWFGPRGWVVAQNERRLDFFLAQGIDAYVSEYTTAGEPLVDFNTAAHRSLVAVAAGTAPDPRYDAFLQRLVEEPIPTGVYRYYDGMLYILSLLVLSGQMTTQ